MSKWTVQAGRVYVRKDNAFMIKNVGYKCWAVYVNDGTPYWDTDWVGSVYSTVARAQLATENWVA